MKTIVKSALLTLFLMLFAFSGQSQNSQKQSPNRNQQKAQAYALTGSRNYVDSDNNGVCDNYSVRKGSGKGVNFVDKNGDGICDNPRNTVKGNNWKQNKGTNQRNGNGCCGRGQGYGRKQNAQPKS